MGDIQQVFRCTVHFMHRRFPRLHLASAPVTSRAGMAPWPLNGRTVAFHSTGSGCGFRLPRREKTHASLPLSVQSRPTRANVSEAQTDTDRSVGFKPNITDGHRQTQICGVETKPQTDTDLWISNQTTAETDGHRSVGFKPNITVRHRRSPICGVQTKPLQTQTVTDLTTADTCQSATMTQIWSPPIPALAIVGTVFTAN